MPLLVPTNAKDPFGDTAIEEGMSANGNVPASVNAPTPLIVYADNSLGPVFATNAICAPPALNPPSPPPPSGHPAKSSMNGRTSHDGASIFMWCPLVRLQCEMVYSSYNTRKYVHKIK